MDGSLAFVHCPAVIIEWETTIASRPERAAAGLTALCRQLWLLRERMQGEPEVVIVFDPDTGSRESIQQLVSCTADARGWPGKVKIVSSPAGTRYYGHKNFGASLTQKPVIVFLDSDLIPDDGWLQGMLEPLSDFRVSLVVANTYMESHSLYANCVGLFWIFDTRSKRPALTRTKRLLANSFAVRRAVFEKFPFPQRPTFRGQCSELASILATHGIVMHQNSAAQASHPPPEGARHFMERALFAGHDECSYRALAGPVPVRQAFAQFRIDLRAVRQRMALRAPAVGAGFTTVVAAACLGFAFYFLKLTGFAITALWPTAVPQMFDA